MINNSTQSVKNNKTHLIMRMVLLLICIILSYTALILPIASRPNALPMQIGQVSSNDIVAPRAASFESEQLTEVARSEAMNAVAPKYLASDLSINRTQLTKLNLTLRFITTVKNDKYANSNQLKTDLSMIPWMQLTDEQAGKLLALSDEQWLVVQDEANNILEQTMRKNIRDYQIQENINNLPGLVNYSITSELNDIIVFLAAPFIVPNSLFSESETSNARQAASDLVEPVIHTYAENQVIVLRGEIITPVQWEALEYFNLIRPERMIKEIIASAAIVLALSGFLILYFSQRKDTTFSDLRSILVISALFLIFLFAAKIIIPNRAILPYFFPLPAFALIIVTLFNLEISIILPLILSILVTFGVSSSAELTVFYIITSLTGAIVLGKGRKFVNFLYASIAIIISGIFVTTAYRLPLPTYDLFGLLTLFGVVALNGIASGSLALLLQFFLSQLLQLTTPLYLIELSRSDHPLLRHILQNAPGTYQHSLQVSNLAEQAANAIGADALLTRVGGYYHDAGKSANPSFFIENQVQTSLDAHDDMDPVIAAQTIIAHVTDGIELAEKYHIPPRIQDFIREHHGLHLTRYQYGRAVEMHRNDPETLDAELFRYPGPKPRSKETGILMLADISEARARSKPPHNDEELRDLLKIIVDNLIKDGSLENTSLSLRDLALIQESFHHTLMNTYHPRIQYPEDRLTTTANP